MTIHPDTLGIDIAKRHLDIFDPRSGGVRRIANTAQDISILAQNLAERDCLVVMEATGVYDVTLRRALAAHGVAHARVNPEQARDFARAIGKRAKTDAIDARMLAEMGLRLALRPEPVTDPARERLTALARRRDQLVHMRKQERTRRAECDDPIARVDLDEHLTWLDTAVARLDREITVATRASPAIEHTATLLRSVPGVGPVTATVLVSAMPELGRVTPKAIAALGGLAPYNNDSGTRAGQRSVRGGRKRVRDALYMAAVAAARTKTRLGDFYRSLRQAGKPPKLAFIALARKLLVILNAVARDNIAFIT